MPDRSVFGTSALAVHGAHHHVAGGLHNVALVAVHSVDHQLERRINEGARLLGVERLHQQGRASDVGEKGSNGLALAIERVTASVCFHYLNAWRRRVWLRWLGGVRTSRRNESGAAFATKVLSGFIRSMALWTLGSESSAALRTELTALPIFAAAFRTAHTSPRMTG